MVWLEQYGIWAMARYARCTRRPLRDWETFCSFRRGGAERFSAAKPRVRPPSPAARGRPARALPGPCVPVALALTPLRYRTLPASTASPARPSDLAGHLARRGTVDGVPDIAEGLPAPGVRRGGWGLAETRRGCQGVLAYGNMAFNRVRPAQRADQVVARQAAEVLEPGSRPGCKPGTALAPGGLGARIYASVDDVARSPKMMAALLVRSLLTHGRAWTPP